MKDSGGLRAWELVGLAVWLLLLAIPASADKVTTDPNAPGARAARATPAADARLEKRVTYQPGYARLSNVAEELTKLTDVTIRAGNNTVDWHVRDIPLVVCVKDMPLGKLLKLVAAAAHVELRAETVENTPGNLRLYRFFRPRKDQEAIDHALDAVAQANNDLATWAWDTLVAYAAKPEAKLKIEPEKYDFDKIDSQQVRIVSELLASFGTQARERAFSGQQVTITYAKAARKDLIRKLFGYACAHPGFGTLTLGMNRKEPIEWTDDDLDDSLVAIRISRRDEIDATAGVSFLLHGIPLETQINGKHERDQDDWHGDLVKMAKALAATKDLKLAPPPDTESAFHPQDQFPVPGFASVDPKQADKTPPLDRKVTLKSNPECPRPTIAQALALLSKISSLNVIAEDFASHRLPVHSAARVEWNSEKTVGATLAKLNHGPEYGLKWFVDAAAGALVGWNYEWRKRHRNLVSKKLLDDIKAKRETNGAELDDLVPLLALSRGQRDEWVNNTSDYVSVDTPDPWRLPVWQLYSALAPEDKGAAKTENGLPMAKFDTQWIGQFLSSKLDESSQGIIALSDPEELAKHSIAIDPLADPEILKSCTLHIRQVEQKRWTVLLQDAEGFPQYEEYSWSPGGIEKHTYEISLTGLLKGEEKTIKSTWYKVFFPYHTLQKEAELIKKATERKQGGATKAE